MNLVENPRREALAQFDALASESAARWTRQERAAYFDKATIAVIETYVHLKSRVPLVASRIESDQITSSMKLTFDHVGYIVDIETATTLALNDRVDLQLAWFDIALEKPVDMVLRNEVVSRCGRIYTARKLEPWRYWRRSVR